MFCKQFEGWCMRLRNNSLMSVLYLMKGVGEGCVARYLLFVGYFETQFGGCHQNPKALNQ